MIWIGCLTNFLLPDFPLISFAFKFLACTIEIIFIFCNLQLFFFYFENIQWWTPPKSYVPFPLKTSKPWAQRWLGCCWRGGRRGSPEVLWWWWIILLIVGMIIIEKVVMNFMIIVMKKTMVNWWWSCLRRSWWWCSPRARPTSPWSEGAESARTGALWQSRPVDVFFFRLTMQACIS